MAKTPSRLRVAPVSEKDMALISEDRLAELKDQARREVEDERRKAAEAAVLANEIAALKRADRPEEEDRTLLIDLPGHAVHIKLDGQEYWHGTTRTVPKSVYDVLVEQIQRAWRHEDEIGGANRNAYQKPNNYQITPHGVRSGTGAPVRIMTNEGAVRF